MSEFGFAVRQGTTWEGSEDFDPRPDPGMWCVFLPHQCDAWDVAGERKSESWREGVPHAEAVAELEAFIVEAQEALAALRLEQEFGEDS